MDCFGLSDSLDEGTNNSSNALELGFEGIRNYFISPKVFFF